MESLLHEYKIELEKLFETEKYDEKSINNLLDKYINRYRLDLSTAKNPNQNLGEAGEKQIVIFWNELGNLNNRIFKEQGIHSVVDKTGDKDTEEDNPIYLA